MKHEFTDEQLQLAILDASDQRNIFIRTVREVEDIDSSAIQSLRTLIYHLPEPQDDWEECAFEDIQKGDRVKRVMHNSDGTTATIEGPAKYHHLTGWGTNEHYLAFEEDDPQDNITLYRIPAPVQHPDPKKHPVILVTKVFDTEHDEPIPMIWDGGTYYESPKGCFHVESITDWSPAKVVAADE